MRQFLCHCIGLLLSSLISAAFSSSTLSRSRSHSASCSLCLSRSSAPSSAFRSAAAAFMLLVFHLLLSPWTSLPFPGSLSRLGAIH